MSAYRYKTLADLKSAYESGELAREDYMILDNDSTLVYAGRGDETDEEGERWEVVFEGGDPRELLEEALTLLGIPWEPA